MALSIAELRKSRGTQLSKLTAEVDKLSSGNFKKEDDRFWQPTVDKAGNGYAVLRFLPAPVGEDVPFVRTFDHGFKGPTGKWYIEKSRTSMPGEEDPVSKMNSELWAQGENSAGRKTVSGDNANGQPGTKRRTSYTSNVYVVDDPENPANNGKVFLFKYGKKIFDKLNDAMNPKFKDETAINPFDLWEGCNFKLKIRKFEGQRNYDKSEFDRTTVGNVDGKTENELEVIWKSEHSLQAFLDPKEYKTYEELQKKLNAVMDPNGTPATRAAREEPQSEAPRQARSEEPKLTNTAPSQAQPGEEDDESLDFFRKLSEG